MGVGVVVTVAGCLIPVVIERLPKIHVLLLIDELPDS